MIQIKNRFPTFLLLVLFAMPTSTQYKFIDFSFSGGSASSSSNSYGGNLTAGSISGPALSGTDYNAWPGITYSLQAPVPPAPELINSDDYYNRLDVTLAATTSANWYNESWASRKEITLDYTQVAGSSNLTDFPVLISLGSDSDLAADALANGDDIVFTSSNGMTQLAHEIEFFDETTGELQAWVQVPTLSYTANTTLFMYYGNSGATNQEAPNTIWDTTDYITVHHLDESPANSVAGHLDSTSNGLDGTPLGFAGTAGSTTDGTGKIDGADEFDGSGDYIDYGSSTTFNTGTGDFAFSIWVQTTQDCTGNRVYAGKRQSSISVWLGCVDSGGDGKAFFSVRDSNGTAINTGNSTTTITDGNWHHLVGVKNGNTTHIYVDGTLENSNSGTFGGNFDGGTVQVGRFNASPFYYADASLDEFRYMNSAPSAEWIETEFNNQNSPGTFHTIGSEESNLSLSAGPSDTEFAIAISPDSFTTTYYVRSDGTLTSTLTDSEWQTYSEWGGETGTSITGLNPNTTYTARVKARHGIFTESPWGPTDSAITNSLSVHFDIDVSSTDSETNPPYELSLDQLSAGSVITSSENVWVDISTNAQSGATIYLQGAVGGLQSTVAGHTISSVSDDLATQSEGVGIQATSVAQGSGGPLTVVSPYNGAGSNVGIIPQQFESIFSSVAAVTNGRGAFALKAKAGSLTPAASDYGEVLTIVAVPSF